MFKLNNSNLTEKESCCVQDGLKGISLVQYKLKLVQYIFSIFFKEKSIKIGPSAVLLWRIFRTDISLVFYPYFKLHIELYWYCIRVVSWHYQYIFRWLVLNHRYCGDSVVWPWTSSGLAFMGVDYTHTYCTNALTHKHSHMTCSVTARKQKKVKLQPM